jgi:serine phosphatase RsbU (regulator of sigma subunit)
VAAVRIDLQIIIAVAKVGKYASSESGDSVEVVERPHGGISVVIADGQRSGKGAKAISNVVVRKAVALLADGVRDGAAARAAHDYLRTMRGGQVSATLNLASIDLDSRSLVISRNSHCPVLVYNTGWAGRTSPDGWQAFNDPSEAIGVYARTKPVISELVLEAGTTALIFTDGVWTAGERHGQRFSIAARTSQLIQAGDDQPQHLADHLLQEAIELDRGRPADDMTLVVVGIRPDQQGDQVRRMVISFPV